MIKLFDKDLKYIKSLSSYKSLTLKEELKTGYKIASFLLPYNEALLKEEQKVEIDDYLFVIKEVNMNKAGMYEVYCKPYFGRLLSKTVDTITGYNKTFNTIMAEILADTDWTYSTDNKIYGVYTTDITNKTALDAILEVANLYQVELYFDTKRKNIAAKVKRGQDKGVFTLDETTLRRCEVKSDTYDLITRLIPIGKDLTMITAVNNQCAWIEDFSYTDEIITGYYVSTVENAIDLLQIAKEKLKDLAQPHSTYKIYLTDYEGLEVGDTIRVIDTIKGIDRKLRIQKIVINKDNLDESYLELGSPSVSFDDVYKDLNAAQKVVNEDTLRNLAEINKSYT